MYRYFSAQVFYFQRIDKTSLIENFWVQNMYCMRTVCKFITMKVFDINDSLSASFAIAMLFKVLWLFFENINKKYFSSPFSIDTNKYEFWCHSVCSYENMKFCINEVILWFSFVVDLTPCCLFLCYASLQILAQGIYKDYKRMVYNFRLTIRPIIYFDWH